MPRSDVEKDIFSIYYKELHSLTELDEKAIKKLTFLKDNDPNAFQRLVEQNLRFVFFVAKQIISRGDTSFNDIIQGGNLGLCIALDKFDPNYGTKIITYAESRIRREINYAIYANNVVPNAKTQYTDDLTLLKGIKIEILDESLTPEQFCEISYEERKKYKFLNYLIKILDDKLVRKYINNQHIDIFKERYGLHDKSFKPVSFRKAGDKYGVTKQAAFNAVLKVWNGLYLIKRVGIEPKHRVFLYTILNLNKERKGIRKGNFTHCVNCGKKLADANLYNKCFYCFENFF